MPFAKWLLAASLLVSAGTTAERPQTSQDIALRHHAPWQVQIYSNFKGWEPGELKSFKPWELAHHCGGSLIAEGWVLTAAHCVIQEQVDRDYRVRMGTERIDDGTGITYHIDRIVRHAGYNDDTGQNDIELVHFVADTETAREKPVRPIAPIRLYGTKADDRPIGPGEPVTVTGWGQVTEARKDHFSPVLMVGDMPTVACNVKPPSDTWLCAGEQRTDLQRRQRRPVDTYLRRAGAGGHRVVGQGVRTFGRARLLCPGRSVSRLDRRAMAAPASVNNLR